MKLEDCPVEIYTGYWKKEGKWVSIDKGEELKWENGVPIHPLNPVQQFPSMSQNQEHSQAIIVR